MLAINMPWAKTSFIFRWGLAPYVAASKWLNSVKGYLTYLPMCGRVIQSSGALRLAIVNGLDVSDSRMGNIRPRYNAAPSQELLVIRQNQKTGERSLDPIRWGLIPHSCSDPRGGRKPINAKAESVSRLPMFRDA